MNTSQEFIQAVKDGDLKLVEQMIGRDPSLLHAKNEAGVSAVLLATYYREPAIAEFLIDQGAQLDIFEAAATGKPDRVRAVLDEQPSLVNAYAPDGFQPLGLASFFGHKPIVELLLSRGANVNSASRNSQRVMPLHSAVAGQYLEIAEILLKHGADVNAKQADDFTPLHEAAQNGQLAMVKLLLSYGADRSVRKADGETPISIALEREFTEIVSLLEQEER